LGGKGGADYNVKRKREKKKEVQQLFPSCGLEKGKRTQEYAIGEREKSQSLKGEGEKKRIGGGGGGGKNFQQNP